MRHYSKVAKSSSALQSVTAALGLPSVMSAGVEAKLEFEITVEGDGASDAVATKLKEDAMLTAIAEAGHAAGCGRRGRGRIFDSDCAHCDCD